MEESTEGARPSTAQQRAAAQRKAAAERIEGARTSSLRAIDSMTRLWEDVVAASEVSNIDDEHDPEGATVAFERAQLRDSLKQARADVADLDRAALRLESGDYWLCERCGGPIAVDRLAARPTARTCITCATIATH